MGSWEVHQWPLEPTNQASLSVCISGGFSNVAESVCPSRGASRMAAMAPLQSASQTENVMLSDYTLWTPHSPLIPPIASNLTASGEFPEYKRAMLPEKVVFNLILGRRNFLSWTPHWPHSIYHWTSTEPKVSLNTTFFGQYRPSIFKKFAWSSRIWRNCRV